MNFLVSISKPSKPFPVNPIFNFLQEIIDMCDYAVGLSRQLNGSIIPSERKLVIIIVHDNSYIGVLMIANLNSLINNQRLHENLI